MERGIILTNRHVVRPGPAVAQAVFANHEEIDVKPLYIDPVHDFGFFQYNPKDLKFINPIDIALRPENACVGLSIKVVGANSDFWVVPTQLLIFWLCCRLAMTRERNCLFSVVHLLVSTANALNTGPTNTMTSIPSIFKVTWVRQN